DQAVSRPGIPMQQILLIVDGVRFGMAARQPAVVFHERRHQRPDSRQQGRLVGRRPGQRGVHLAGETRDTRDAHGRYSKRMSFFLMSSPHAWYSSATWRVNASTPESPPTTPTVSRYSRNAGVCMTALTASASLSATGRGVPA